MTLLQLLPRACAAPQKLAGRLGRTIACLVTIVLTIVSLPGTSQAQNRFWVNTTGGTFTTNANWSLNAGGAGGASFPVAANTANFTIINTYTVSLTANATNTGLVVANGTVTLDLAGNSYTLTGATAAAIGTGNNLSPKLFLKNGTLGVDTDTDRILIGGLASNASMTVTTGGKIGNGTIDPDMIVGDGGTGSLTLEDNGRADVGFLNLGQESTASGTAKLTGPNAKLDASGVVNVGVYGTGALTVEQSAKMTSASAVTIGKELGANGTATITGFGSNWAQGGSLTVGEDGDGGFSIQSAASMSTAGGVFLGYSATGFGTAVVNGIDSTWDAVGVLQVGINGLGNMAVSGGGRATTGGATTIAANAGSEGNLVINGAGSRWTSKAITVAAAGKGNLTVSGGGVANTTGDVSIASLATGVGKATVSGSGSTWNIAGGLNVAALGTGTLTVEADANLTATGALTIGDPAAALVGTLNFNGGSINVGSFTRAAGATLNWTNGTMFVNGGTFNNGGGSLTINGSALNDLPALRLGGGAQSLAANLPNLTIGSNRQGAVIVSGGSNFQTTTASLGSQDGGTGSLHVEGQNSSFATTGDLGVGGTTAAAGGLGGITLGPGGTVTAGGTLRLWGGGTITLAGGTMRFTTLAANGGKFTFNSGTVQVLSAFSANAAALDALVGSTRVLGFGRKIDTVGNAFNLQSDLNVTGGAIAGNTLVLSAGTVARIESAGSGTFANGITNPAGARIHVTDASLSAGTTFSNSGDLRLAGGTATINGTGLTNTGLVEGSGRINAVITNNTAGQVRAGAGQRLEILGATGTNVNNGLIDVDGGTIEFGREVINSSVSPSTGLLAARDATLRFNTKLSNSGALTFSAGVSDVFGDVTNLNNLATAGRIVVTGGAQANFFDDVVNNGVIQVSAAGVLESTAVFLGSLSGNGVVGSGQVFIEGDARPGFSPGTMAFGGDVSFGPLSTLNIELAGVTPGTQYDRVTVAETASIGGELEVSLLNGYRPTIGSSFQVLSATGGITGTFSTESLPELAGGASWSVEYGVNAVTLEVGGVLGDFNHDGRVDTADYSVWRDHVGSNTLAADASGNGSVDQSDYNIWRANFGQVAATGGGSQGIGPVAAVPEPTSAVLLLLSGLIAAACSRSARKQ